MQGFSALKKQLHRFRPTAVAVLVLATAPLTQAQEFVWAPDFPVGAAMITISAQDQDGNVQSFADLVGEKGLLFMLSRSFDW